MSDRVCRIRSEAGNALLSTAHFQFALNTTGPLRAASWENRITGRVLSLGNGPELEIGLDAAERRIWIEGWRVMPMPPGRAVDDHREAGRAGYSRSDFDDSKWTTTISPPMQFVHGTTGTVWARTHLFLPDDCRNKPMKLVLGGMGLWDFRSTRVFINGRLAGVRRTTGRWFEPGQFDLGPRSAIGRHLRFGQDNVIAVELSRQFLRTARLDELDPKGAHSLPYSHVWSPPFEQHVVVGRATREIQFRVGRVRATAEELTVDLRADNAPVTACVTYRPGPGGHTLHKFVTITNEGDWPVRMMNVRLGQYDTGAQMTDGEQGFPVYVDSEFFLSLAHPAGWAMGQNGAVSLAQYPGQLLAPGKSFRCMEAVYGVSAPGGATEAFRTHLRGRMRRTRRGHERPLAIFEYFGGWDCPPKASLDINLTETFVLKMLRRLDRDRQVNGTGFDYASVDFWVDGAGDMIRFHPTNFPAGFDRVRREHQRLGIRPGLWIDSTFGKWNIGANPVVARCHTHNPAYPYTTIGHPLCRATDPFATMFTKAFRHHIRRNGVRLLKFDNLQSICYNTAHDHLPGIYSKEPIVDSVIEFLRAMDEECPDVFLMLYWGYRSPWWLLHGDTLFEPGIQMEAASPSPRPSLYARDGVTVSLDQAQAFAQDVPALGKDSLGIWLSDWGWNSCVGKERWPEGMVMDMCRGHLLLQPWTDGTWLTPPERKRFAHLLHLLRQRPECFGNSRPILADPWKGGPYGYCCTDGRRAFFAINNNTWRDATVTLQLDSSWGLRDGQTYHLYCHHPAKTQWAGPGPAFVGETSLALRPFDVVLIEAVPHNMAPTGPGQFPLKPISANFDLPTRELSVNVRPLRGGGPVVPVLADDPKWPHPSRSRRLRIDIPPCSGDSTLAVAVEVTRAGRAVPMWNVGRLFAARGLLAGQSVRLQPILAEYTYPAAWQGWRVGLGASRRTRVFELDLSTALSDDCQCEYRAWLIPE